MKVLITGWMPGGRGAWRRKQRRHMSMASNLNCETDKYIHYGRGDGVAIELLILRIATMLCSDCLKVVSFFLVTSFPEPAHGSLKYIGHLQQFYDCVI